MTKSNTVADFGIIEEEVFVNEGVRVVIRGPRATRATSSYRQLFERRLGDLQRVELLVKRIKKIIGNAYDVVVINGRGEIVGKPNTSLGYIRDTYVD